MYPTSNANASAPSPRLSLLSGHFEMQLMGQCSRPQIDRLSRIKESSRLAQTSRMLMIHLLWPCSGLQDLVSLTLVVQTPVYVFVREIMDEQFSSRHAHVRNPSHVNNKNDANFSL